MKRKATFADIKSKNLLSKSEEKTTIEKKVEDLTEQVTAGQKNAPKRAGRPQIAEPARHPVTLKFTNSEIEDIKLAAGDVPLATYLKKKLTRNELI